MADIPRSQSISTRQQTIATRAQQAPKMSFTSLNHHIDLAWLHEAYRRTRKDGAPGVDGQTAVAYAEHLEENLQDVLDRAKSGRYRAPAVKRAYIPKGDGSTTRPIGVPTFEDKILQRAVAMVLEPIYEQDFLDCSYGFRPGRSAHQALQVRNLRSRMPELGKSGSAGGPGPATAQVYPPNSHLAWSRPSANLQGTSVRQNRGALNAVDSRQRAPVQSRARYAHGRAHARALAAI